MERVLVIEDDRAVQKALKRLFESEGYAVDVASDGSDGLAKFRSTTPSALVLDLRLPGVLGQDVCREVKREAPAVPVIILSAKSEVTDKVLLLEIGADDYVTNPSVRGNFWRVSEPQSADRDVLPPAKLLPLATLLLTLQKWK